MAVQAKKVSKHATISTTWDAQREHILVAVTAIQEALSISQAAKRYNILKMLLSDWLWSRHDIVSYGHSQQRLSIEEKNSLEHWVL